MIKVFWQQSKLFLGTIEEDNAYEFWWADVGDFHIEILPTNIIHGSNDFQEHHNRYVFLANRGVTIGHSSMPYDTVIACKAAAEKWVENAILCGVYIEEDDMDINELRNGIDDFELAMILGNTSENGRKTIKTTSKFSFDKLTQDLAFLKNNENSLKQSFERLAKYVDLSIKYERDIRETLGFDIFIDEISVDEIYAKLAGISQEDKMMLQDDAARIDEILVIMKEVLALMRALDTFVKKMDKLHKISEENIL